MVRRQRRFFPPLECLGDETFDVIWAQSVFTHLPPDQILKIMQRLKRHMHAGSRFYATFSRVEKGIVQQQLHNWYYDLAFFQTAASECGFQVELCDDWVHPYAHTLPSFARSGLLKFTFA